MTDQRVVSTVGPPAADTRSAEWRDLPSRTDPIVAELSGLVGGPVGKHALVGRARFFTPLRAILLLAVVFLSLGWFSKAACIQQAPYGPDGAPGLDWSGSRQYTALCYSDTVPLYGAEKLSDGAFPYRTNWTEADGAGGTRVRYMEYPVVSGLYQYVSMRITKAWHAIPALPGIEVAVYFNVVALGLSLAWLVTVWATTVLAGRRVWDAALVACSPLVIVHAFTNFDPLATSFGAAGLLAWSRRRPVLAGILLGVGGAAKLYPLFFLGPLLILCIRTSRMKAWSWAAGAAAATWAAINAPIAILYPDGWAEFFRLNSDRHADPDSIYNVVTSFTGWAGFDGPLDATDKPMLLNTISAALFAVVCLAVAWIALTAPRRPRVAQLCFLVVAGFLLTNKVWSPQYSLWLVPLAVLALPHRRILLAWMAIDALVWVPRMFYFLGIGNKGLPEQWFTGAVIVRDVAVLGLCAVIVRQIYRPAEDLVRYGWIDDPVGGVLDRADDSPPTWLPRILRPRPTALQKAEALT